MLTKDILCITPALINQQPGYTMYTSPQVVDCLISYIYTIMIIVIMIVIIIVVMIIVYNNNDNNNINIDNK